MSTGEQLPTNDPVSCIAALKATQEQLATLVDGTFHDLEMLCASMVQRGIPAFMSLVAAQQPQSQPQPLPLPPSTPHTPTV